MEKGKISIGALAAASGYSITHLRRLSDSGSIPFELTKGGQRRFDLNLVSAALHERKTGKLKNFKKKKFHSNFELKDLKEDLVWAEIVMNLELSKASPPWDLAPYAFTEMLNNAVDHSQGKSVEIEVSTDQSFWNFRISDDGIGVFRNIRETFNLSEDIEAVGELTKGKRTTMPLAHSGEGIFFTSKLVDTFRISSNNLEWVVDNALKDNAIGPSEIYIGTTVQWKISLSTTRTFVEIAKQYSKDFLFSKSSPVVKLFEIGVEFVSRSEAKRLIAGLEQFSEITFDYKGVIKVGQGFVDEIYRVWKKEHPTILLDNINTSEEVDFMLKRDSSA